LPLQIFAHRGHHTDHPENTVGAFDAATAIGAHGIELDLHLSRDGRPVVLHDAAVDRTTDGSGSVANLNWAALRQLDAGAGERIPTFDQVLQTAASSLRLNVHLKATGDARLVPAVVSAIVRADALDRAYLATDAATWQQARAIEPRLTGCHLGPHPRNTPEFLATTNALGCRIVQLDWRLLTADYVARAHALAIEVHAMHLVANHDDGVYATVPPTGADAVLTDYPDRWL
tara:strand:+ start:3303 stop:3995 length:693 start_codon:yes stop_codon:yes gene_type:complete